MRWPRPSTAFTRQSWFNIKVRVFDSYIYKKKVYSVKTSSKTDIINKKALLSGRFHNKINWLLLGGFSSFSTAFATS